MKDFTDEAILRYSELNTTPASTVLQELFRETQLKTAYPNMISGHLQGTLLRFISLMMKPEYVLEVGTFTGYSAICLTEGLVEGGRVMTIESNPEMEEMARNYIEKAGVAHKIELIIGDALQIIGGLGQAFDLCFLDGDKEEYVDYYRMVLPKMRRGGIIIADNVLWSGKVLEDYASTDRETRGILAFNELVSRDNTVERMLLPLRDGLMIIRKK